MKQLLTMSLLLLSLLACEDRKQDPNVLPAATQTGANTGGALVDGKVWVAISEYPNLNAGGVNATIHEYANGVYNMQISLRKSEGGIYNSKIRIYLSDSSDFTTKTYQLSNIKASGTYNLTSTNSFSIDAQNVGTLTITKFDKYNSIISGVFSFKAKNAKGEIVSITEGRFDKRFL